MESLLKAEFLAYSLYIWSSIVQKISSAHMSHGFMVWPMRAQVTEHHWGFSVKITPWNPQWVLKSFCAVIVNSVTLLPERARYGQDSGGQLFLEWQKATTAKKKKIILQCRLLVMLLKNGFIIVIHLAIINVNYTCCTSLGFKYIINYVWKADVLTGEGKAVKCHSEVT